MVKPINAVIRTGLRSADAEDLVEELNRRTNDVAITGIKSRMNTQVESEAENSYLSYDEIRLALAKNWLKKIGGAKDE